jgi:hypothetical protein
MSSLPFLLIIKQLRENASKKSIGSKGGNASSSSDYEYSPLTAERIFSKNIKGTTFFNCDVGRIVMNQLLENEEVLKVIEKAIENFDGISEEVSTSIDKEICSYCKPAQEFIDLMHEFDVKRCYYGHLHSASIKKADVGEFFGINFCLVSADAIDFLPINI